jgi:hypothetical protein
MRAPCAVAWRACAASWREALPRWAARRRVPRFFQAWAVAAAAGRWSLPWSAEQLLAWQRWELVLTHRERKSSCGVGTAPCWQAQVAVLRVPWRVGGWSLVGLAGERVWGLERAPVPPPGRWSAGQPLPGRRREPWELEGSRPLLTGTVRDWGDDLDRRVVWGNATLAARRVSASPRTVSTPPIASENAE